MPTRLRRESRKPSTSSRATAIATAARDTAACSIASPANTAPDATSVSAKTSTLTSNCTRERPPRKFAERSSRVSGSPWTSPNIRNRCPRSDRGAAARLGLEDFHREVSCHEARQFVNWFYPSQTEEEECLFA